MLTAGRDEFGPGRGPTRVDPRRAGGRLRPGYCDEAAPDAGGLPGDILAFVAWGMDREMREVFELVRAKLEEIAEDQESDDE
jgi:hypothetical protein